MLLLILSLSFVLLNPTEAVCRPRNSAGKVDPGLGHTPEKSSLTPPPTNQAVTPSPSHVTPPSAPKAATPSPSAPKSSPSPKVVVSGTPPNAVKSSPPPCPEESSPSPNVAKLKMLCTQLTSYPDLCVSAMTPFLDGNAALDDMKFVFETAVKVVVNETNGLKDLITSYEGKATSPMMVDSFKACKNDYDDALEDIQTAMDAAPSGDYGTLTTFLSSAIDSYGDCDDEFRGLNPLAIQNARLRHLLDNCLAFAERVHWA
ncbi:hypothetical protein CRG98_001331 [Punica granatum]|uniref:Pectinesterase inhibitor domain-containing protein n=1 Tax=Punica granatum TaxID=22663 RepID=A0A2I0LC62_PUNGR|nr:hypothetical protein CRG98_001331 [Punica granatum]